VPRFAAGSLHHRRHGDDASSIILYWYVDGFTGAKFRTTFFAMFEKS
jgi:hypothetical protein